MVIKKQISGCWGFGGGEWVVIVNEYGISFGDDANVLTLVYSDGCTTS